MHPNQRRYLRKRRAQQLSRLYKSELFTYKREVEQMGLLRSMGFNPNSLTVRRQRAKIAKSLWRLKNIRIIRK